MSDEVFLVSPSEEYKETFLTGMAELEADAKLNANSGEFTMDLEEARKDFGKYVSQKLGKDKPESERMSLFEVMPEEAKAGMSAEELDMFKNKKVKPEANFWIMKKEENGDLKFVGAFGIRPNELDEQDMKNGAKEYSEWKGCLGKNVGVGVETSSFLIPSARGKGYIDAARGEFMDKLKDRGIDTLVSKVVPGNMASHKKQQELVDICGGASFDKKFKENDVKRYIINVNPEAVKHKMSEKLKMRGKLGSIRGLESERITVKQSDVDMSVINGKMLGTNRK